MLQFFHTSIHQSGCGGTSLPAGSSLPAVTSLAKRWIKLTGVKFLPLNVQRVFKGIREDEYKTGSFSL